MKIYTINPFINAKSIPRKATVEGVITDHFYLFNVYNHNPYIVKEYMEFIDVNFDYAFSKLGYQLISYECPDRFDNDDSSAIEFINDRYDLTGDYRLDRCYQMNKETVIDLMTGNSINIYFNDYTYYDVGLLGFSILSDVETEIPYLILDEMNYLTNLKMKTTITQLIYRFMEYQTQLDCFANGVQECYDNDMVFNSLLTLCQLKNYVYQTVKERGD